MKSRKFIFLLTYLFFFLCFSVPVYGQVEIHVDRNRIALDETLTLSIIREGGSFLSTPDLSPLIEDFQILGRNQSSQTQIINGQASSSTELRITLAPKRSGELTIPSLSIGKQKTDPVTIVVDKNSPPKTKSDNSLVFLETDVTPKTSIVQAQVIYTLRVYLSGGSQIYEPEEFKIDNALIEKLGDVTYSKNINGLPYKVFERKYAIFPQQSGTIDIPQITVPAVIPIERRRSSFFDSFSSRGKEVRLRSEGDTIEVEEKPGNYPQAVWLPADNLTIDAHWGQSPETLKVGESVTLTLTTTAAGLLGSQLPPVTLSDIEGIKMYQNKADVFNDETEGGITGTRRETIAIIATRPGVLRFPEIRIPWWNKKKNSIEYASIPAINLQIEGIAHAAAAPLQTNQPAPLVISQQNVPGTKGVSLWWITVSATLATVWLITLFFLVRTHRQLALITSDGQSSRGENSAHDLIKEGAAFKLLKKACLDNDPLKARNALYEWVQLFWPEDNITSLTDLSHIQNASGLSVEIAKIDRILYGSQKNTAHWNGKALLDTVTEFRNRKDKNKEPRQSLGPLYLAK